MWETAVCSVPCGPLDSVFPPNRDTPTAAHTSTNSFVSLPRLVPVFARHGECTFEYSARYRSRFIPPLGLLLREIRCDETVIDLLTRVPVTFHQADNRHTIILVQTTSNKKSRTFMDFEKVSMAMDGARPTPPPRSPRARELS